MTKSVVGVHEAKTHLSRLLERVEEGEEILVARRGVVVARLVAAERRVPQLGTMRGQVRIGDDFDDPLPPEFANALGS
ncbi:MAG: type II toxin-antitoxin system Phd/YefM family antitoxin [Egibacteraceae bacterium]